MRTLLLATLLGAGLSLSPALLRAEDAPKMEKTVTGVLVCNHCGNGMLSKDDPEAAAAKHPKACSLKTTCAASGFEVISGKTAVKLDTAGNDKAKEYLSKEDSAPRVTIKGDTNADGTMSVTSIEAAPVAAALPAPAPAAPDTK